MSDSSVKLDPVTLTLVQNRLDHISLQMGWAMTRTARSPILSQAHDFSCFITDPAGYILSQADGLPIHTGGGGFAVRALLEAFGDDIVLRVDAKHVSAMHLPAVAGVDFKIQSARRRDAVKLGIRDRRQVNLGHDLGGQATPGIGCTNSGYRV